LAFDPISTIAQNIINSYKLRNPSGYDPGEEQKNREYLEDLLTEIFTIQLGTKASVAPGVFTAGGDPVTGVGGPVT